jgi:hypothetical protein
VSTTLQDVSTIKPGNVHADQGLIGSGLRCRNFADLQHLGPARTRNDDGAHVGILLAAGAFRKLQNFLVAD